MTPSLWMMLEDEIHEDLCRLRALVGEKKKERKMVGESLEHNGFMLEPSDYERVIVQLKPLLMNPRCEVTGKFAESLITALERGKQGGIFHIFVEIADGSGRLGYKIHNDPEFAKIEEKDGD